MNKPKVPLYTIIISWLTLLYGIFVIYLGSINIIPAIAPSDTSLAIAGMYKINLAEIAIHGFFTAILGIGLVVSGYGIGRMSKWALYLFTAMALINISTTVVKACKYGIPTNDLIENLMLAIQVLALFYLWKISKKFA
jgi:hypothetical protein